MIVNKILKNQILKIVKSYIGLNNENLKIKRLENEVRSLRGKVNRMEKKVKDA